MRKKIISILLGMIMLITPVLMTGCMGNSTGGDGDGEGNEYFNISDYLTGFKVGSTGTTNFDASIEIQVMMYSIAQNILSNLYEAYGDETKTSAVTFSEEDTHVEAYTQDNWLWECVFIEDLAYLNGTWRSGSEMFAAGLNTLVYQLYKIMLGEPLESIIPGGSRYIELRNNETIDPANFNRMSRKLSHTGVFYYEADSIAEFVLNYIIGTNVVSYDNTKFNDIDSNGTFDFYELNDYVLYSDQRLQKVNIIKNFNAEEKTRSTASSKSNEWNSITWGSWDDGNTYQYESFYYNALQDYIEANISTQDYRNEDFKNYVNNVYYSVYMGIEYCNDGILIVNYFDEDEIRPNIDTTFYEPNSLGVAFDTSGEKVDSFQIDADEYKSVVIMSKANITITSCWMIFELDPSITEEVTLQINAKYKRCRTSNTHEHTLACDFQTIEANLGQVTLTPGEYDINSGNELVFDLSMTEEMIEEMEKLGFEGVFTVTEFTTMGITAFELTEFKTLDEESGMLDRFVAEESDALQGAKMSYRNDLSDFVEITFDVVSTHSTPVPFRFAFVFLDASSR